MIRILLFIVGMWAATMIHFTWAWCTTGLDREVTWVVITPSFISLTICGVLLFAVSMYHEITRK